MYTCSTMEQKSQKRIRSRQNKQKISNINASYNQFGKGLMRCHHSVDISNERCNNLERNDETVSTKKKTHFVNIEINIKAPLPSSSTKEGLVNSFISKLHSISPRNSFATSQSSSEFAMPTPIKVESFDELVGDYVFKDSYSERIKNEYGFNIEQQIKTEDDDFLSIISDIGSSTVQCNDRILNCADKNIKKLTFNKIEQPTNLYVRNKVVEKENAVNNTEVSESAIEEGDINTFELLREESIEHEINTKADLDPTEDITVSYNITPSARKKILELNSKSLTSSLELEEAHEKEQSRNNSISACQDPTSNTIPDKLMTPISENRKKTRKNKRHNRISDTESSECHDDNKDVTEITELGFKPNVSQPQDVSIETAKSEIESLAEDLCEDPKMTSLNKNKQLSIKIVATEALVQDDSSMNLEQQTNRRVSITERCEMKRCMKQLEAKAANDSVDFINSSDAMTTHEIIDLEMDMYNSHNPTKEQTGIVDKKDVEAEKHIVRREFFDTINPERAARTSGESIKMLNDQSEQEIIKLSDVPFPEVFEKENDDRKAESHSDSEDCNCYSDDNYSDHDHISNSSSANENLLSSNLEYTKDKTNQNNSIKSSRKRVHEILSDRSSDDSPCNDMKPNTSKENKLIKETVSTELQNTKGKASVDITSDVCPNLEIAQTQGLMELKALPDISDNEGKNQEGKKDITSKVNEENVSIPFKAKVKLRKTRTSRNTKHMKCNVSSSDSSDTDCNTELKLGNNEKRISPQLESNEKEMRQGSSDKEIINSKNSPCISGKKVWRSQLPNLNASSNDSSSDSEISTSLNLSKPKSRPLHASCDEKLKKFINSKKQKLLDTEDCSSSNNDSFNNVNADVNNRSDSEDSLQELIKLRKTLRKDANHVALDCKNMVEEISDSKVTQTGKKIVHNPNVEISEDNTKNAQDSLTVVIEAYNNYYNIDNFIVQSPKIDEDSSMKTRSERKTLSLKKTKNDSEAALRPSSRNSTDSEVVAIKALPSESSEKNNGAEKNSEVERRLEKKALFEALCLTESNNDTNARLRSNSHNSSTDLEVLPINKSPSESSKNDASSKESCKASLNIKFKKKTSTPKTNDILQCVKKSSGTNEKETSRKYDTSKPSEETTGLNKKENENSSKKSVEENINEVPSQEILDIVIEVFSKTDEFPQSKSKKAKSKGVAHNKSEKTKKKTLNTKSDKKKVIPRDKKTNGKNQKLTDDSDRLNGTEEKQQHESPRKTEDEIDTNLNNKNVIRRSPRKSVQNDSLESTKSSTVSEGLYIIKEQNKAVNRANDNTTEPNIESKGTDRNEISNENINEVDTNITSEDTSLKPSGDITPRVSGKNKEKIIVKFDLMKLRSKSNSTKKKDNSIISYFREGEIKQKEIQKQDVNKQKLTNFIKDNALGDALQQSSLTEKNRNDTCPDQNEDVPMIGSDAHLSMSNNISNNDVFENDTRKSPRIKEKQCKRNDDQHEVTTQQATTKSNRHSYEKYTTESTNVSVDKEDELNSVMHSVSTNNVGNSKNTKDKNLIDSIKHNVLNDTSLQLTPPAHTSNLKSLHYDTVAIKKLSEGQNMSNSNSISMWAHTSDDDINKSLRSPIITEKQSKKHEDEAEKENQSKTDEYQIEVAKRQQTPAKSNIKTSDNTIESEDIIPCSQINKSFTPRKRPSSLCITSQIILRQQNKICLTKKDMQSNGKNIAESSEPKCANNLLTDVASENDHINDIDNDNEYNIHDARDSILPNSLESQLSNKITKGHNYDTSSINTSQQTETEHIPEMDVEQCMENNTIDKNILNDSLLVHCGTNSPGMSTTFDTDKTSDYDLEAQLMSMREKDKKRKLIDKQDDHRPSKRFKGEVNKLLKPNASGTQIILNEDSSSGQSVQAVASTTSSAMSNTTQILNRKQKGKEKMIKLIQKTFDELFKQRFGEKWKSKEKPSKKQKEYKRILTTTSDDETTNDEDFEVNMKGRTHSKANISKQYSSKKRKALVMNCIEKLKSVKIHKNSRKINKDNESSSNSDSSEGDPTKVSHEFIETIKVARTHMNALTRADGLLNNLRIQTDFDIPKAHRIAVRLSGGPSQAQKQILAENKIKMREGHFTEEEDFLIITNFSKFCEVHNLEDDPVPFLNLGKEHPLPYAEKVKFVQFIGQGLPRRYLRTIHSRFQLLMSRRKNGSFTQVEDEVILNCKGKLDMHKNELAGLEYVLCRSKKSILKRYEDLMQSKDLH